MTNLSTRLVPTLNHSFHSFYCSYLKRNSTITPISISPFYFQYKFIRNHSRTLPFTYILVLNQRCQNARRSKATISTISKPRLMTASSSRHAKTVSLANSRRWIFVLACDGSVARLWSFSSPQRSNHTSLKPPLLFSLHQDSPVLKGAFLYAAMSGNDLYFDILYSHYSRTAPLYQKTSVLPGLALFNEK